MAKKLLLLMIAVALISPAFGSGDVESTQMFCNLTGTWFGGGDGPKFLLTIVRRPLGDYTISFEAAFSMASQGVAVATACTGSIMAIPGKGYEAFAIVMTNASGLPGPTVDVAAIHGVVHVIDCNTIRIDYDFYGGYFANSIWTLNRTPFLDPPDFVPMPPPFSETYRRMPTRCTQCPKS